MKRSHFLGGLFCLLLVACGNIGVAAVKPEVEVEIVNQSSRALANAVVRFGDFECKWGHVGKTASYLYYPHPITPQAELHWDVEGKHRIEKLDLSKIYPRGKSGRLTFTVYDGRAEASFHEKSSAN